MYDLNGKTAPVTGAGEASALDQCDRTARAANSRRAISASLPPTQTILRP